MYRYIPNHLVSLEKVFQRLRETEVKVKMEKCHFLQPEVRFLGHQVSAQGVSTDPDKITAVKLWPAPGNVKELRSFLDLVITVGLLRGFPRLQSLFMML